MFSTTAHFPKGRSGPDVSVFAARLDLRFKIIVVVLNQDHLRDFGTGGTKPYLFKIEVPWHGTLGTMPRTPWKIVSKPFFSSYF